MNPRPGGFRFVVVLRRMRTIGGTVVLLALLTALFPVVVLVAALVDAVRALLFRRPWMGVRLVAIAWVFLFAVVAELVVLGLVWVASGFGRNPGRLASGTRRADYRACELALEAVEILFRLEVERPEAGDRTGPLVLLARHAGFIDTLLPNILLGQGAGFRMRYVLSNELLANPLVDVWGNRLPNYFVRPEAEAAETLAGIAEIGRDLASDEAVVLFPEGARFTTRRRDRILASLERRDPVGAAHARQLVRVLPPHTAGTLALLEGAAGADVVVMAHSGLEDFGDLRRLWSGDVVGSRARVRLWHVPRGEIPGDREESAAWLWDQWARLDAWIGEGAER